MASHTIIVIRDHGEFGPYDESHALEYFSEGKILLNDLARVDNGTEAMPFSKAVARCGWKLPSPMKPWEVVRKIGVDSLFPIALVRTEGSLKLRREVLIALAGLAPLVALFLKFTFVIYVVLALYVSVFWGVFFWTQFKTDTSSVKRGVLCFCVTACLSTTLLVVLHSSGWLKSIVPLTESRSALMRFVGFFCCAGLPEEICKAAVIFWLVRRPGRILKPQDVVLYGLLSGFGFGIHEGLRYQLGMNRALDSVDATYIYNFLRLTSLPFLHACWCGIASYFISYAAIAPMSRYGLWMLAILIPTGIHSMYDAFCNSILGLGTAVIGVVLMMAYLAGSKGLRRKLL